jgi:hypothetical protein
MAGPRPNSIKTGALKSRILNLAQTSVYLVKVQPPDDVVKFLASSGRGVNYGSDGENLELLCTEAVLPGNSLATHDITSDYHGVTEKMAYRRIYDETIDLTFYVDSSYKIIEFFDGWMDFISGVGSNLARNDTKLPYVNYRMNFPKTYKNNIFLTKFEKDKSTALYYTFIQAFPTNVVSMPVSYEASNILKCTVSFSYIRYVRERLSPTPVSNSNPLNSGIPSSNSGSTAPINPVTGKPVERPFKGLLSDEEWYGYYTYGTQYAENPFVVAPPD